MLMAAGDCDARGFATEVFASAEDFLGRDHCQFKSIVSSWTSILGGMSGIELRRQLTASGSRLPVIFMTGFDDEPCAGRH